MNIAVNSRLIQNPSSGIPLFIKKTYQELLRIDNKNNYFFFQPFIQPQIGNQTVTSKEIFPGALGALTFDGLACLKNINRNNISIFHGPAHTLPFYKPAHTKFVLTIHDLSFILIPRLATASFKMFYTNWLKRSVQLADIIVADSDNTRQDVCEYFRVSPSIVTTAYLGVDAAFVPASENAKSPYAFPYLLTVATHPIRKNIQGLLELMARYSKTLDRKLIITGYLQPSYLRTLESDIVAANLRNNIFVRPSVSQSELINLYQHADALIYASFYEGFGLPVLEAMACKCPVVCSDVSSLKEVLPNPNLRFNPRDVDSIFSTTHKLLSLNNKDRNELVSDHLNWSRKFTWTNTARKYLSIFTQVYAK